MSRTKKLKLLAKSTKTPYHPTQRDAAAYERVTQFVMQQARMAHEAGFQKGIGLDTAETMGAMVRDGNEAREHLAGVLASPDQPVVLAAAHVFLSQPPPRMVPKPQVSPVALVHTDSAPEAQPSAPSDAAAPPPPDAAPADESPVAPPP